MKNLSSVKNATMVESNKESMTESNKETVETNTVKAMIEGNEKKIILGFSIYNMERPKDKKGLLDLVNKKEMMDVMFHLAKPEIFWDEGIELRDINGKEIPKGTENVYVPADTSDTYWRYTLDDRLEHVEVHDFKDLQEYGKAIGNTTLYSRTVNNVELLGIASIASKNEIYRTIFATAKKFGITMNAAMLYYGVRLKKDQSLRLAMGCEVKDVPELQRTVEKAEEIIENITLVFGEKEIGKRYVINVVNQAIGRFGYETVIEALSILPAKEVALYKMSKCGDKEDCLAMELALFIDQMQTSKEQTEKQAA